MFVSFKFDFSLQTLVVLARDQIEDFSSELFSIFLVLSKCDCGFWGVSRNIIV